MNIRRATASAVIGSALALGFAAPAHADTGMWIDYIFSAGQTASYPASGYKSFVGISPAGHVVRLAAHSPGSSAAAGAWSQAYSNICIYWNTPVNYGPLMNNPHSFAQELKGYVTTSPDIC